MATPDTALYHVAAVGGGRGTANHMRTRYVRAIPAGSASADLWMERRGEARRGDSLCV